MPVLISEDKLQGMTQDQRADLENELRGQANQLGHDLRVGDSSSAVNKGVGDQVSLDADLHAGPAIFQQMSDRAIEENARYLHKVGGIPMERIERALRLDGLKLPDKEPDPALVDLHDQIGVPLKPETSNYNADFGRLALDLPLDRLINIKNATQTFAADLKLDPILGKGVIEHIAETGQKLKTMTPEQLAKWKDQQNSHALKGAGSRAKLLTIREKATKVLNMSGTIKTASGEERLSEAIKTGPIIESAWLQQTLAAHFDALQTLERAKKRL